MNFFWFILRRLVLGVFVLFCVVLITFVLSHSIGGNPVVAWLGKSASLHPALAAAYAEKYHLNSPITVQFYYYVVNLLQGNLGYSPSREFLPVSTVIAQTLPYTIQIVFFAFLFSILLGVILGVISARYHDTTIDGAINTFYLAGYSSPPFFVALVLLILLSFGLGILPSGGAADPYVPAPVVLTGIPMVDSLFEGNIAYFASSLFHVVLPSMTLTLGTFGVVTRVLRSSMLDVMNKFYIRTARAKGLSEQTVFYRHGLRNALIPVVTLSSIIVTWLITGTIFVENIFAYPGLGRYVVTATVAQDYPGILATTLVFAVIIVASNLVADLLYLAVDPEIRLG
jgi:peptide/nickel transport system permease protein